MCGLVAFQGEIPYYTFHKAIQGAAARGPHSHGWAGLDKAGWRVKHGAGRLTEPPGVNAYIWIGHSRLATSTGQPGGIPDPAEGQPLIEDNTVLAHNGASSSEKLTVGLEAPQDSRGLLKIAAAHGPLALASGAVKHMYDGKPHAMIAYWEGFLWAVRIPGDSRPAHPLYITWVAKGCVLSSAPTGRHGCTLLPVGATQIGERP